MDAQLDERKVTILKAIIKTYLETGEPVGSRTISKYSELKLSSATIRNEMSDLEEMGYVIHQQDVFLLIRDTGSTLTRSCRRKKMKSQNLRM